MSNPATQRPPTLLQAGDPPREPPTPATQQRVAELTLARIEHAIDRLTRIETRICVLLRQHGLDAQGRPLE